MEISQILAGLARVDTESVPSTDGPPGDAEDAMTSALEPRADDTATPGLLLLCLRDAGAGAHAAARRLRFAIACAISACVRGSAALAEPRSAVVSGGRSSGGAVLSLVSPPAPASPRTPRHPIGL